MCVNTITQQTSEEIRCMAPQKMYVCNQLRTESVNREPAILCVRKCVRVNSNPQKRNELQELNVHRLYIKIVGMYQLSGGKVYFDFVEESEFRCALQPSRR